MDDTKHPLLDDTPDFRSLDTKNAKGATLAELAAYLDANPDVDEIDSCDPRIMEFLEQRE